MTDHTQLSRRDRQIMDILFAQGEATVNALHAALPDAPAHTAIRTFLKILQDKGHVKRRKEGREYVYMPIRTRRRVGRTDFKRVLSTFFNGSLTDAVVAHLSDPGADISDDELQRLKQAIEDARHQSRGN